AHEETVHVLAGETRLGQGLPSGDGHHGQLAVIGDLPEGTLGHPGDVDAVFPQGSLLPPDFPLARCRLGPMASVAYRSVSLREVSSPLKPSTLTGFPEL